MLGLFSICHRHRHCHHHNHHHCHQHHHRYAIIVNIKREYVMESARAYGFYSRVVKYNKTNERDFASKRVLLYETTSE